MEFSEILNWVLSGGLVAALVGILTLRATVSKATAEAETVKINNADSATRILIENIVEPLKKELSETREELRETKKRFAGVQREMVRFRKAVEIANACKFRNTCPVLAKLCDKPKQNTRAADDAKPELADEYKDSGENHTECTAVASIGEDTYGQPP